MRKILLLLLLALWPTFQLFADATKIDSVRIKQIKAFRDVRFFKLDKPTWKAFKKKRFEPTSDYFKPKADNINNPDLIEDSIYTKAYRKAAFNKTQTRYLTGKIRLIGGIWTGIVTVVFVIALLAAVSSGGRLK